MVDFLDSWAHIIPVWILDNILDQLIFPKLQKEVGWSSDSVSYLCTRALRLKDSQHGWWPAVLVLAFSIIPPSLPPSSGSCLSQCLY